jgi:hypothetical protein
VDSVISVERLFLATLKVNDEIFQRPFPSTARLSSVAAALARDRLNVPADWVKIYIGNSEADQTSELRALDQSTILIIEIEPPPLPYRITLLLIVVPRQFSGFLHLIPWR